MNTTMPPIMTETGDLDISDWDIRIERRKRNRMKRNIKLNKEQTAAYERFRTQVQPEEISEQDFLLSLLFMGISSFEQQIMAQLQQSITEDDNIDLDSIVADAKAQAETEATGDQVRIDTEAVDAGEGSN